MTITRMMLFAASAVTLVGCDLPASEPGQGQSAPVPAPAAAQTVVPPDSFTAADRRELDAAIAKVADRQPVFPGLPNPPLGLCVGKDETLCRYEQLKAVHEWKQAFGGDYGAQRNVAYCLSNGCDGLRPDRVQGCAWRMVIIDAADPQVIEGDVSNMETECRSLTPSGRSAATLQATRIAQTIARPAG